MIPGSALRAGDQFAPPPREQNQKKFTPESPGVPRISQARCKNLITKAQHLTSLTEGASSSLTSSYAPQNGGADILVCPGPFVFVFL
jgi:hypothetical protein